MEKVLEMLAGVLAVKPINVTVNVYNTPPISAETLTALEPCIGYSDVDEDEDDEMCDLDCDNCDGCPEDEDDDDDEDVEEDEIVDCDECNEAKSMGIWNALKVIIVTQMPDGEDKRAILQVMSNLENSILG
jgi:hypothetical protein